MTTYTYDKLDRLGTITDPNDAMTLSGTTTFDYDAMSNVIGVHDSKPTHGLTTYTYDLLSRLKTIDPPATPVQSYEYDNRDRVTAFVNSRPLVGGQSYPNRVEYRYEDWGPRKAVVYCGNSTCTDAAAARKIDRGHDLAGDLTSITDSDFGTSPMYDSVYDLLSRPQQVTTHFIPGGDRTLTYGYDRFANLETFDLTDGGTVY